MVLKSVRAERQRAGAAREHAQDQRRRMITSWLAGHGLASVGEAQKHPDVLRLVLDTARSLYGGCPSISVTTVDQLQGDRPPYRTALATGEARALDEWQYRLREGPCVDAVHIDAVTFVRADDFLGDQAAQSWPELCPAVATLGVRSSLSIAVPWDPWRTGLHTDQHAIGSINLYSSEPHAFGQSETRAMMFGAWVASITIGLEPTEVLLDNS
ncbi:GAF domain-containing protein [Actinomycetospora sp. C-140]